MRKNYLTILVIAITLALALSPVQLAYGQGAHAKHFEGIKIRFFCGGPPGCPFATVVYRGARAAEMDLGCTVEYIWSDWNPEKMVKQFKEAIAARPDGIAIMGHPGQDALEPLIDQAIARGIIVTSQNTDLPRIEQKYRGDGFGYVGQDLYQSGYSLAKKCVEKFGLKKGDRALVWGLLSQETRGLRTKGAIDALEKAGLKVDYMEISPVVNSDPPAGTPVITGYISSHPDVKLIITDHGGLTGTVETYLRAAGKKPGQIKAAGFDLTAATVEAIKNGYCSIILDQQPYLQGYLPILQICLTKKYGFSGLHIDTGAAFIDASNVDAVADLAKKGIR
ncbi:MAG TPA: sugar ABC transporter substrate-binding protein [Firmicutes bacterium]|nr:sugar ABC transporter substrate-binding protein [Bacillota bacterium]